MYHDVLAHLPPSVRTLCLETEGLVSMLDGPRNVMDWKYIEMYMASCRDNALQSVDIEATWSDTESFRRPNRREEVRLQTLAWLEQQRIGMRKHLTKHHRCLVTILIRVQMHRDSMSAGGDMLIFKLAGSDDSIVTGK